MQEQINGQPRGLPHQPRQTLWEGGWCVRRVKCHARLDGELQARHGGAYDNTAIRQGDEEDSECQASHPEPLSQPKQQRPATGHLQYTPKILRLPT